MKRHIAFVPALLLLFASCSDMESYFKTAGKKRSDTAAREADITVAPRDTSLTPAIAYNDLFLDSLTVETYIQSEGLPEAAARELRNFYNMRNYQFAWLYSGGFTEGGRMFWNLYTSDSTNTAKKQNTPFALMDTLLARDTLHMAATDTDAIKTELFLTQRFVPYARTALAGVPQDRLLPVRKMTVLQWADTILNERNGDTAHASYARLKNALRRYTDIAKGGGWQQLSSGNRAGNDTSSSHIIAIKKRLLLMGDLKSSDTTGRYNDTLATAIKNIQQQVGLKPDGIVTDSFITVLNVPVEQRMQQIIINLNRMLWMPQQKENFIEVNIPAFMLQVHESDSTAFSMPVIVGREGAGTVLFTGRLNQLVFSPYWNIPASIVREELLPVMKTDPSYLKSRHMEVVRKEGDLPVIRQLPGGDNAMGKVKFLFPNRYDIYFHDTPAKELFNEEKRAFSHGCIRVADAEKLATYLLRDDATWTPEKIHQAMNSGTEKQVSLKTPVPVVISYYTAWVTPQEQLYFRDDVYRHDKAAADLLFISNSAV